MGKMSDAEIETTLKCAQLDAFIEGYEEGRRAAKQIYK